MNDKMRRACHPINLLNPVETVIDALNANIGTMSIPNYQDYVLVQVAEVSSGHVIFDRELILRTSLKFIF